MYGKGKLFYYNYNILYRSSTHGNVFSINNNNENIAQNNKKLILYRLAGVGICITYEKNGNIINMRLLYLYID